MIILFFKLEGVIEYTLGNKSARNGWFFISNIVFRIKSLWVKARCLPIFNANFLVVPEISYLNDRVTVTKLVWQEEFSVELRAIPRFDISSVVLVEVVQLVVHVYWSFNVV